jgi:hypothetical protein
MTTIHTTTTIHMTIQQQLHTMRKSALLCIVSQYSAIFWNVTSMLNQCMEITVKFFLENLA